MFEIKREKYLKGHINVHSNEVSVQDSEIFETECSQDRESPLYFQIQRCIFYVIINQSLFCYFCQKSFSVKSIQIRSYFWYVFSCTPTEYGDLRPNTGKYGPEITPCLDNFQACTLQKNNCML